VDEVELTAAVRLAARISDTHPDYPALRIRQELTDALRTVFQEPIKRAGNGYGQQMLSTPIVAGVDVYRIPPRALVAGLVTVEALLPDGVTVRQMVELSQRDLSEMLGTPGDPGGFVDNADFLRLGPSPSASGWTLRQWYKLRASKIVAKQTAGQITSINAASWFFVVNSQPLDAAGAPIGNGSAIDVVAPNGSHELHLVSVTTVGFAGNTYNLPVGTDMSMMQVGDFVRAEDESEWPTMLPQEFHRTLADAAAVVILSDIGTPDKAAAIAQKVVNDVARMREMLEPRVRDLAKPFVPRYGPLRANRRWTPPARI